VSLAQASPATQLERLNPFPGLRTFEPDEDYLFFGREQQIDELLRRLRTTRFLAIVGSSGSGKSSLVRAGLIPSLYGGAMTRAGSSWRVAILRPGEDPIGNLAEALTAPEALAQKDTEENLSRSLFETTLRASNRGLVECIRQARIPARANVLVLVDQFEEIFRFKRNRRVVGHDDATGFVKLLLEAERSPEVPCYIALTMRSDFIGNCMEFADLPETVNEGLYLVPRMTRDELRSAITGPIAVGGATVTPRLVSRLLNDVGDDPDQLPILQHSLLRTWSRWEEDHEPGEPLDLSHYEAIGTMKEALSRHAEEAYGELGAEEQGIAATLFKALTDRGTDGRGIRRPAALSEICSLSEASQERVTAVVDSFRRPGRSFLMPPADVPLREGSILDLSHESLMRIWGRLAGWVADEARCAQLYLGAARAAARYEVGTSALWRDPELQLALTWREKEKPTEKWARRYDPGFGRAMAFLDASKAARDRGIEEREKRRRRALRRARLLAAILGGAALITLVLGAYSYIQEIEAETLLRNATQAKVLEEMERARAAAKAKEALRQKALAERQTRIADQERRNVEQQKQVAEQQRRIAESERRKSESAAREARAQKAEADAARLEEAGQRAKAEELRQQADRLRGEAVTSELEARRLSMQASARALALQIQRPQQNQERDLTALLALQAYRLNRDSQGEPEDPDLFNALRTALVRLRPDIVLRGHDDGVRAVAVAPDGQSVVSGGEDGKLLRFDLRQPGAPRAVLGAFASAIRSVALAADGSRAAAGFADGRTRVWDLRNPAASPRELAGAGIVGALAFQPGRGLLASGSSDGAVRLWDLDSPEHPVASFAGAGKRVAAVAFSPDGNTLAAGLANAGGALLWDVRQPSSPPRTACAELDVRSIAFSPDGRRLACGTGRGPIVLAGADQPAAAPVSLHGHASSVNSLSFSPRGDFLGSASSDGKVRLWNLDDKDSQPVALSGHEKWVWAVAFTPDGGRLISGGEDGTARVWPARTELMAGELCREVHRGLTPEEWKQYMPSDLEYQGKPPCPAGR